MKKFEILYARNSNGSINEWGIGVQDDGPKVVIWEGVLGGELTRTERKPKAKNIGKMNETSAYEQGIKDAESRWNLKKKKGYKSLDDLAIPKEEPRGSIANPLTLEQCLEIALPKTRTDENNLLKPMLAKPLFDSKTGKCMVTSWPMIGQPKLNGFRMMCRWEKVTVGEGLFKEEVEKPVFRSREGIRFDTLEHIEAELTKDMFFTQDGKEIILDGELYYHGWLLQRINSAVNKKNEDTTSLQYHIFDIGIENVKYINRTRLLFLMTKSSFKNIWFVNYELVEDINKAEILTDRYITQGYEGSILRNPNAYYQFGKRNYSMVKLKRFQDKEFKIVDVIGGDNSPELGVFVCLAENGLKFKCTPQGTHEVKKEYLTNKQNYIGKMLTVKFYERTKDGIPFHTTGIAVREFM